MPEASGHPFDRFLQALWKASPQDPSVVFDPWNRRSDDDIHAEAWEGRRERLRRHLAAPNVRVVIVGEAPGARGARVSGVAFTSERLIQQGAIPRLGAASGRLSTRRLPWSEASATIMWGALYKEGLAEDTVMWNAYPWHPHPPGLPHKNRRPSPAERTHGLAHLEALMRCVPGAVAVAVGEDAKQSLMDIGVPARAIRHPSYGGATVFREQLARLAAELR